MSLTYNHLLTEQIEELNIIQTYKYAGKYAGKYALKHSFSRKHSEEEFVKKKKRSQI